jgi:hypothetical protein
MNVLTKKFRQRELAIPAVIALGRLAPMCFETI